MVIIEKNLTSRAYRIHIDENIEYRDPREKTESPGESFERARKEKAPLRKVAWLESGILYLLAKARGVRVRTLTNPAEDGFDMLVGNEIRKNTFGRRVAVDISPEFKLKDVNQLAQSVEKAKADGCWVFTDEEISYETKRKAHELKISVFDASDIRGFARGEDFTSFLQSYEFPSMGF